MSQTDFTQKNDCRKLCKKRNHTAYRQGRKYRKEYVHNGAFGNFDKEDKQHAAMGTMGELGLEDEDAS